MQEGRPLAQVAGQVGRRDSRPNQLCGLGPGEWEGAGRWQGWNAQSVADCLSQDKLAERKALLLQAVQR